MEALTPYEHSEVNHAANELLTLTHSLLRGRLTEQDLSRDLERVYDDMTIEDLQWLALQMTMQSARLVISLASLLGEDSDAFLQRMLLERSTIAVEQESKDPEEKG